MTTDSLQLKVTLSRGDFYLQVDLCIPGRGITAIFGPSGCGKTSLLRAIAGLEPVDRAHSYIRVCGTLWCSPDTQLPPHQRRVGYVFQEASLFDHLSVKSNLEYGMTRQPSVSGSGSTPGAAKVAWDEVVELLDLGPLLARAPSHLSGGERQRVALGRALLANPVLLLMDEPLAALDQGRKQDILPYLERLQRCLAIPMLYVSHALDEIVQLADHLLLMDSGRVIAEGPLEQLLSNHPLLVQRDDAFTLLEGQVMARQDGDSSAQVELGSCRLQLTAVTSAPGSRVKLRIYARDVSLCLDYPERTSILNILPARILSLMPLHAGQCLVSLVVGKDMLLARVSQLSVQRLSLAVGQAVYAQIKAVAVER